MFHCRNRVRLALAGFGLLLIPPGLLTLAGCASGGDGNGGASQPREVTPVLPTGSGETRSGIATDGSRLDREPGQARASVPESAIADTEGWSIILGIFPDTQPGMVSARSAHEQIRTRGGLPNAQLTRRGGALAVTTGSFQGPGDPAAQRELDRVRAIRVGGATPYQEVVLAPPARVFSGAIAEHDLRNARRIHGARYTYSLQIGVYGRPDNTKPSDRELAEYRETAERAANDLRAAGEVAFYYHSARRSMVTVGLFTQDDLRPASATEPGYQSPALLALKRRYPHNLLNGAGVRESLTARRGDDATRLQPSRLVSIPSS